MRRHTMLPDVPRGYPLSPCRGMWSAVVPVAATNLITNPSVELGTTGYSGFDATIARTTDWQRHGVYGLSMAPTHNVAGVDYTISLSPNTTYTWSLDAQGPAGMPYQMRVYDVTALAYLSNMLDFRAIGRPERHRLSFITSANSSYRLTLAQNGGDTFPLLCTDGWQLCQLPYDTTYIDGDQPGCAWIGNRHASTSSRSGQSRRGGRVVNLQDYGFEILGDIGLGMSPAEDIATPMGLIGGALYQRTVPRVRVFSLVGVFLAATFAQLQRQQAELQDVLTAFAVAEQQPLALRYQAMEDGEPIGDELELLCHYTGGLEGNTDNLYREDVGLQFSQYLPLITTVGEAGVALGTTESITDADYIVERQASGVWHALNGGVSGPVVSAVAYGPDGNLYAAGTFATAYNAAGTGSPVTVNHVAKWDGTAWSPLGSGFNSWINALVFDAAGTLFAGGVFTDAAYPYLAKWNGSAWGPVGLAADATNAVYTLAIDKNGILYVGGFFTNWAGIASADRIVQWDGTAWSVLGTGANDEVFAIVPDPWGGNVFVGGSFTNIGGMTASPRIAVWNGSTWSAIGTGFNGTVRALAFDASHRLFAGGGFTDANREYISWYAISGGFSGGGNWVNEGLGVNNAVFSLHLDARSGALMVGGLFTTAGGITLPSRIAQLTGSGWLPVDIDLPGSPYVAALASHPDGRLVLGYSTSGTATASTADTDVTNTGTAPVAPVFLITGPGLLESIVNWTTGKAIYTNLTLQAGETVTIDLTPGAISLLSSYRGNVGDAVLGGSDLAGWRLLPGRNTVIVKSTAAVLMRWRPAYQSIQGATR